MKNKPSIKVADEDPVTILTVNSDQRSIICNPRSIAVVDCQQSVTLLWEVDLRKSLHGQWDNWRPRCEGMNLMSQTYMMVLSWSTTWSAYLTHVNQEPATLAV